ncbi:NAD-dependent epimerase/dehydratase family protein [Aquisediminimonas profunda]|uniref:NAD-dependent epimerase/dehydratase family protein n=1 Tax=Aquisediminimonas profunda TaxID=1550733 RepID=UPI001C63B7FB|nr:NAD-dependent epimerase/dehydratase family protein [Aquisediminimonas profunda]
MKILVIGGTGGLGGHAAIHLRNNGHEISIGSRNPPPEATPMAKMPFVQGDYMNGDYSSDRLKGFDALVFVAGNDGRHVPATADMDEHLRRAALEAQPAVMRGARDAGIKRVVQIGSFYPQAAPELEAGNYYVQSRRLACELGRAEGRPGFDVISINPPFMVGGVPGLPSQLMDPNAAWAIGDLDGPMFGPSGGTNFMSYNSLSQAIEGALMRGEPGKAYLVGDQNLSFADYLSLFFKAAGKPIHLESRDEAHPIFPDWLIFQGRGNFISFEPDPKDASLLGYARNDVVNGAAEAVQCYLQRRSTAQRAMSA